MVISSCNAHPLTGIKSTFDDQGPEQGIVSRGHSVQAPKFFIQVYWSGRMVPIHTQDKSPAMAPFLTAIFTDVTLRIPR